MYTIHVKNDHYPMYPIVHSLEVYMIYCCIKDHILVVDDRANTVGGECKRYYSE